MKTNMTSFRVLGPDETASNRLQVVYDASKKTWMADLLPEDADGGELARDGRVMEMLSEKHIDRVAGGLSAHGPAWVPSHL
jgi:xylulose-5-phosphate/fructose-6-phosphate phosphoketolase